MNYDRWSELRLWFAADEHGGVYPVPTASIGEWIQANGAALLQLRFDQTERVSVGACDTLREVWNALAIKYYREVLAKSLGAEQTVISQGRWGSLDSALSYEAAHGLISALDEMAMSDKESRFTIQKLAFDAIATLERSMALGERDRIKPRAVSPLVFAVRRQAIDEVVDRSSPVCFDLDGDGESERWGWVRPGSSLLVSPMLPPEQEYSGLHLLGERLWNLFPRNGLVALGLFDDDRDGHVAGDELSGVAVWTDWDGDGHNDPGESQTAAAFGVSSIEYRGAERLGNELAVPGGVKLQSGVSVNLYDWIGVLR